MSGSNKHKLDPTVEFVAGTAAGAAGLCVGFPLDTVKVRFQSQLTSGKYRSTWSAITTIAREERIAGLFRGITSPLATCALLNGLIFGSYGYFIRIQMKEITDRPSLAQMGLAGAGTGVIASVITSPVELIKIRQQTPTTSHLSSLRIAGDLIKSRGIAGLYRGIGVTALRDLGYGAYFATYEGTCRMLRKPAVKDDWDHASLMAEAEGELDSVPWYGLLLAGGIAGIAGWLTTFPFDVIKTRVQGTDWTPHWPYRSTSSTFMSLYRTEGPRVFVAGLAPTLIRSIPVNMATFGVFELAISQLS